jgi:hypothetical protein
MYLICLFTDDSSGEWQALEGLSTIAFKQRKFDRCCDLLQQALIAASYEPMTVGHGAVSGTASVSRDAERHSVERVRHRLVEKLSTALSERSRAPHSQVNP